VVVVVEDVENVVDVDDVFKVVVVRLWCQALFKDFA